MSSFSQSFVREHEIRTALEKKAKPVIDSYKIDDIFDIHDFTEYLFNILVNNKCILRFDDEFAGVYFRFEDHNTKLYFENNLKSNEIVKRSLKFSGNYFQDVFDGYRDKFGETNSGSVSSSTIETVDWKSRIIEPKHKSEIRAKAVELVSAIRQSEYEEDFKNNAIAHVEAAIDLIDAPDPNWKSVVELLNSNYVTAFLNGVTLVQLILAYFL